MPIRPRMRPTFEIPMKVDGSRTFARLESRLARGRARGGGQVVGQVVGRHAYLQCPPDRQSLLSPHLNLDLRERDGGVVLSGRFSPRPNVWTGFMALYGVLGLVGIGGLMLGWAQLSVKEYPWGFWLAPAAAALFAFVYGAAVIGQGLTQEEMYTLRNFVDRAVAGDERGDPQWEEDPA